jgi:para-aminobenzoate synthetase
MATNRTTIKTLLVDNFDSYTFNLFQYLAEVNGEEPVVINNNQYEADKILQDINNGKYDNIVISPGPGLPSNEQGKSRGSLISSNLKLVNKLTPFI